MFARLLILFSLLVIIGVALIAPLFSEKPSSTPVAAIAEEQLPKSVLRYPSADEILKDTVSCYTKDELAEYNTSLKEKGFVPFVKGQFENGENMEIHSASQGKNFVVIVTGPDATGTMESCEVASGNNIQLLR